MIQTTGDSETRKAHFPLAFYIFFALTKIDRGESVLVNQRATKVCMGTLISLT